MKTTLIIDMNWLLISRLCHANSVFLTLAKSIKLALTQLSVVDSVVCVADYGSWRKDIQIPKFLEETYKGTREYDNKIDWEKIWREFDIFLKNLSDNGFTVVRESKIEGDDWCFHFSKQLNKNNCNAIIWSRDKDLQQLVHKDPENGVFTICWDLMNGVYIKDDDSEDDEYDFLFNPLMQENSDILNTILKSSEVHKVSPKNIVIEKILKGDVSDNIKPVALRKSKTGSRVYSLRKNDMPYDLDIDNDFEVKNFLYSISDKYNVHSLEEMLEHFSYNKKLVKLEYYDEIKDTLLSKVLIEQKPNIDTVIELYFAKENDIEDVLANL